jgi:hypothetical protein
MDAEHVVQQLINDYNFKPGKRYTLERYEDGEGNNGGTIEEYEKLPTRTFQLKRDPPLETGLYDLEDEDDFKRFFEKNYGNLPNGKYTVRTSRGGNDGFATFFRLRLENGEVVDWWKKSQANNPREGYNSTYFAFPYYFNKRKKEDV